MVLIPLLAKERNKSNCSPSLLRRGLGGGKYYFFTTEG